MHLSHCSLPIIDFNSYRSGFLIIKHNVQSASPQNVNPSTNALFISLLSGHASHLIKLATCLCPVDCRKSYENAAYV